MCDQVDGFFYKGGWVEEAWRWEPSIFLDTSFSSESLIQVEGYFRLQILLGSALFTLLLFDFGFICILSEPPKNSILMPCLHLQTPPFSLPCLFHSGDDFYKYEIMDQKNKFQGKVWLKTKN